MKWAWVLIVMLLIPMSGQAESTSIGAEAVIIGEKWNVNKKPHSLQIILAANDNGNYLRASVRVYVPKKYTLDAVKKGKCRLIVNNQIIPDTQDFLIFGENGQELWFPSLMKRDRIGLNISWKENPHVEYTTVALESNQGTYMEKFETARAERFFSKTPVLEQAGYYRELSLDDVCSL